MEEDPVYQPLPEDRPGGFDWGAAGERGANVDADQEQPPAEQPNNQ